MAIPIISSIPGLGKLLDKATDRIFPDKAASREAQSRINEQEVAGGPPSRLRLWRGFLGWALSLLFVWEVAGRTVILTYWPHVAPPPSVLKEISALLLGMLGLGF